MLRPDAIIQKSPTASLRKLTVHTVEADDEATMNFPPGDVWMNHLKGLLRVPVTEEVPDCIRKLG